MIDNKSNSLYYYASKVLALLGIKEIEEREKERRELLCEKVWISLTCNTRENDKRD
jgi:hypothetical protein